MMAGKVATRRQFIITLESADADAVEEIAARSGLSRTEFIRKAVLWAVYGAPAEEVSE